MTACARFHSGRHATSASIGLDVSKAAALGGGQIYTIYLMVRDQDDYLSPDDLLTMHAINGAEHCSLSRRADRRHQMRGCTDSGLMGWPSEAAKRDADQRARKLRRTGCSARSCVLGGDCG
jgi:hypothetical protein